jgi:hypothetical protein
MKENWMKDETDTWEEQGTRANLGIDLALQNNPRDVDWYKKELEKLDAIKINRLEEEKKILVGKSKVLVSRSNQNIEMNESLKTLAEIPSDDPITRKEAINKEIDFIRKKWSEMNQKQLEKKLLIEIEVYENDKRFDLLKEEEKDLIIAKRWVILNSNSGKMIYEMQSNWKFGKQLYENQRKRYGRQMQGKF